MGNRGRKESREGFEVQFHHGRRREHKFNKNHEAKLERVITVNTVLIRTDKHEINFRAVHKEGSNSTVRNFQFIFESTINFCLTLAPIIKENVF